MFEKCRLPFVTRCSLGYLEILSEKGICSSKSLISRFPLRSVDVLWGNFVEYQVLALFFCGRKEYGLLVDDFVKYSDYSRVFICSYIVHDDDTCFSILTIFLQITQRLFFCSAFSGNNSLICFPN